jgi:beta-N-acetylhexosaminidase
VRRPRRLALLLAALAVGGPAAGCGGQGEPRRPNVIEPPVADVAPTRPGAAPAPAPTPTPTPRLTDAQLAGQHVVFPIAGHTAPRALRARIRRGEAGGVILLARRSPTIAQVRRLTARLQRIPRPPGLRAPLLVMVDQEGGPVKRLPGAPARSPSELAAAGSAALARAEGLATARTLRAAGVNVALAPVLDVARSGGAIAREGRALGATPQDVARVGVAFAEGLQQGGVAATAKHFPGFGAATLNTDYGDTVVRLSAATLRGVDGVPFAAAVRRGVAMVMLASARYPAFSRDPAVLSAEVVGGELRERLGFRGVTVSDDLEAPAFDRYGGAPGAAVQAMRAGVDVLLCAHSYAGAAAAARAVADGLERGELARADAEASLRRVLHARSAWR